MKSICCIYITGFLFSFFPLNVFAVSTQWRVRLSVTDHSGEDRIQEPVTSGVPIPQGFLFPEKQTGLLPLRLVDSQKIQVPAQFQAASFWSDGSIRWVLIDFVASVDDSDTEEYFLEKASAIFPAKERLKIKDEDDYIEIDTGKIKFRISKTKFNFLDHLVISGSKRLITPSDKSGAFLLTDKGLSTSSLAPPNEVIVEEEGPLRSVIRIRGHFITSEQKAYMKNILGYTVRIYAYAQQDFIRVFFTLENNGRYGYRHEKNISESVRFTKVDFNLHLQLSPQKIIESDDYSESFSPQDRFFLSQRHSLEDIDDEDDNFTFTIKKNDSIKEDGKRAEGWIHINDGDIGIIAGIRYFWQNYPKTILFAKNTLTFGLWPQGGSWPPGGKPSYLMRGGVHKTYEMIFRFYKGKYNKILKTFKSIFGFSGKSGKSDHIDAEGFIKSFKKPLLALADKDWIAESLALGFMAQAGLKSEDDKMQEAFDRYEQFQGCKVNLSDAEEQDFGDIPPTTLYTARESRTEQADWYGWMDFGDIPWGGETGAGAYSSGHYDWPYGMLLQFLRSGNYAFFELGAEMAQHRMDIDQYHTDRGSPWLANFQKNEFGSHDRSDDPWEPNPSHTWIQGLLLYYYLTGNLKSRDTALDVGRATEYYWTHGFGGGIVPGTNELRIQAWSIENLLGLYHLTNQKRYFDLSRKIYFERTRRFISAEGYIGDPTDLNIFQHVLAIEPFIKLNREIESNTINDDIIKITAFLKQNGYKGGITNEEEEYQPLYLPYQLILPTNTGLVPSLPYNIMMANALAYVYMVTGWKEYMEFARRVFQDFIFYWQVDNQFVDTEYPSAITFEALHFPGSLSKIHGWINRYPMVYLFAETHPKTDLIPPKAIKDLEVRGNSSSSVILDWTATGDDGMKGKASTYQIKYSQQAMDTEIIFFAARNVPKNPLPKPPGSLESFLLSGLVPGKMYFFAIRARDEEKNLSPMSNIVAIELKANTN